MQIFGQVWLWSLGSFLLGVLFTWLLLVRPARKRVVELEEAALRSPEPTRTAQPIAEPPGQPGPNKTDRFLDDLFESQRPPQMPQHVAPPVMPPPPAAPAMAPPSPGPTAPPEPPIPDESDTELSDAPFRQFTQSTTVFVPPTNLPQPSDVPASGSAEDWFTKEDEADPHAITDVEDDEQVDDRGTIFTQHTTPIPAEMIRSLDEAQPEPAEDFEPEPDLAPAEVTQHFEAVQPVEPFEPVAEPALAGAPAESGRSLFEPVVPVGEYEEAEEDDFVPPGPFGPGSAMPLPGGGAPAPEFNVKASVTALRYCTQDNPQFDRIVAEVWFRTPSDAERVGFRVLS
ncbi:hypothetical protein JOF56_002766 [Kibdelosporangium banguiense]|uniref:Uncharacterized protein n=1 Tax=Kibdelosporangium banguiense TaxID=1365924 RepID=A0ABS4TD84_9PSEU|nr:hypothetical protein [Kibdelosporangium banguiense]MBP2322381.1 hypothetical protein [Kibdelosporangium banguiense]